MYRSLITRALGAGLLTAALCVPAWAQQKIAFVNTLRVLAETAEGSARIESWEAHFAQKRQELEADQAELQKLQQQFAEQQLSLNQKTKEEMQRTIEEKATNLKRRQEDAQREAEAERNQIIQELSQKIGDLLSEYGASNGYAAIFLLDGQRQIFVDQALDITDHIIELYDQKHPGPASSESP